MCAGVFILLQAHWRFIPFELFVKELVIKYRIVNCMGHVKFKGENKIIRRFGGEDNHFEYLRLSGNIISNGP
jgi:hypothetical protein